MTQVSVLRLVNGSSGDPVVYLDFPGAGNAILLDAGQTHGLARHELRDLGVILLSHHHIDHVMGLDRVIRETRDAARTIEILGPEGTIERFEHRLAAIQFQVFPFNKIVYRVTDLDPAGGPCRRVSFAMQRKFEPESGPPLVLGANGVVHDCREFQVRYAPVSHTAPCVAYAVDVKRGHRFDREKARERPLREGPWIAEVLAELDRPEADRKKTIRIDTVRVRLEDLVRDYFSHEPSFRIAFVTDTRAEPGTWEGLVRLARRSRRLYCDAYYPTGDRESAAKHGHMTASDAARLAAESGARSLWLVHLGPRAAKNSETILADARSIFPSTYLDLSEEPPTDGTDLPP